MIYVYIYIGNNNNNHNNNNCNNSNNSWLVVWNIFLFPYIGKNHPNLLSYFSGAPHLCRHLLRAKRSAQQAPRIVHCSCQAHLVEDFMMGIHGILWEFIGFNGIWWDKKPPNILGSLIHKNFGAPLTWLSGTRCDKKPPTTLGDSKIPSGYLT